MRTVAVLGAGSWGTALAVMLAGQNLRVRLWDRSEDRVAEIRRQSENTRYLPGVRLPAGVEMYHRLPEALSGACLVLLVVPSHAVREMARALRSYLPPGTLLVNCAKGLEEDTLLRPSQVLVQELGPKAAGRVVVLSGPSHAEEVGRSMPTAVVVAAVNRQTAEEAQELLMAPAFRVYTHHDVLGVELAGALKNVIALATGISDGLGLGDNTRAALMTRGLAEIARLGVTMGAEPLTFAGLAGVGDLIVTCGSMHSRNRRAGIELGRGSSLQEALSRVGMVVEGVRTTRVAMQLAERHGVEMPITNEVYRVLFAGQPPRQGVANLMERGKAHEAEEILSHWGPGFNGKIG